MDSSGVIRFPSERIIKKNTLLHVIPKLLLSYSVTFDLYPIRFQSDWTNVFHMTTGGRCCDHGDTVPAVFFYPSHSSATKNKMLICSSVNDSGGYCFNSSTVYQNQWTAISISQILDTVENNYRYTVRVGGKQIGSVIHNKTREFSDVKVYVSNPWLSAAQASIRNLVINPNAEAGPPSTTTTTVVPPVLPPRTRLPSIKKEDIKQNSFVIQVVKFVEGNRPIKHYDVIVCSLGTRNFIPGYLSDSSAIPNEDIQLGRDDLYVAGRIYDRKRFGGTFTVGDGGSTQKFRRSLGVPENRPLAGGQHYAVFLRAHISDEVYGSTKWYPIVQTLAVSSQKSDLALTIGVSVAGILLLVIGILLGYVIMKRRSKLSEETTNKNPPCGEMQYDEPINVHGHKRSNEVSFGNPAYVSGLKIEAPAKSVENATPIKTLIGHRLGADAEVKFDSPGYRFAGQ